jgi:hypothetical protein
MSAYDQGYEAFQQGVLLTRNPYDTDDFQFYEWKDGWLAAHEEQTEED